VKSIPDDLCKTEADTKHVNTERSDTKQKETKQMKNKQTNKQINK
jgi:hypothetical protein